MPRSFQIVFLLAFSTFFFSILFSTTFVFSIFFPILAQAQTDPPAVVTFTLDFPTSTPERYSLRIPSRGSAHYESSGRVSSDSDQTDNFDFDFALSTETRQKIFALAAKAGYFQKDVASSHKGLAFTGQKTLGYKDDKRSAACTYNYSTVPAVQELTSLLQSLSGTLEFGQRLQYDLHYQKLALDEELKRMEEMAHHDELTEVTSIQPILDQIIADSSVMNVTRARAQRLLDNAGVR